MELMSEAKSEKSTTAERPLHLFEGYGVELEYMIVDSQTTDVRPLTDKLMHAISGEYLSDICFGKISYSNELALHVVELKTTEPEASLEGLQHDFQSHVEKINAYLAPFQAKLLPTAAHPWMNPFTEMKLWNSDDNSVYEAYHRIFDCRGHGWANLQSAHLNLPFCGDDEFFKLHAAIRALLPIMSALSASSPILEGSFSGKMDKRLDVYRQNQKRIPKIAGDVIPEISFSEEHYKKEVLAPIYKEIAPFDTANILQYEWLNSRGAIARFDRMAIEIRVLDIQECPCADIAIHKAIVYVLQNLIEGKWASFEKVKKVPQEILVELFLRSVDDAESALIDKKEYLELFGLTRPITAGALWRYLLHDFLAYPTAATEPLCESLEVILREGTLARRIMRAWSQEATAENLKKIYYQLGCCLEQGKMFIENH